MIHGSDSFREIQRFPLRRTAAVLAVVPSIMSVLLIWQVVLRHPWGKHPMSNASIAVWTMFLWIVYVRLMTFRLVTRVRDQELIIAMRGFWKRRRILAGEISFAEIVVCDPVRDYGGYGFRSNGSENGYLATSHRGVRLHLSDGSTIVVSSQRPTELVGALQSAINREASGTTRPAQQ
jgi:hypothetical protein